MDGLYHLCAQHLLLPPYQVFEEVDRQVVAVAEIGFDVDSEEDVDLSLRAELGREGSGGNLGFLGVDLLHHKLSKD